VVSRCHIYETLYRTNLHGEVALSNMEKSLVALYSVIRQFLSTTIALFEKRTVGRALYAVVHPAKIEEFIATCDVMERRLESDIDNCERVHQRTHDDSRTAQMRSLLADLRAPLVRIDARLEALFERSNATEQCSILQWVSNVPYESDHYAAKEGQTDGTTEWILQHPIFREWRSSSASTLLWQHGIRTLVLPLLDTRHLVLSLDTDARRRL
jgi:hypothetical protein